jgi:hypothetical protein
MSHDEENVMKNSSTKIGYKPGNRRWLLTFSAIAVSSVILVGCGSDSGTTTLAADTPTIPTTPVEPAPLAVTGDSLACATPAPLSTADVSLTVEAPDSTPPINISHEVTNESQLNANAGNVLKRLTAVVPGQTPDGTEAVDDLGDPIGPVHPILVSYAEQVVGPYELGDGSADIGDPATLDDIFTSLSMDNGATWKKVAVGDTSGKSSIAVKWGVDGDSTAYGGHSHKPTMNVKGDNILVAWNDKYCPSGNPFDLDLDADPEADLYKVNGNQGSIDYEGVIAPNGKNLYEVPFSCVWTARGEFVLDPEGDLSTQYTIQWRQAQQMTTGTRDSNKIWIASADVGFALTWQEDTEGLRSGKGAGPGEGYSGATTNHGTDIWYTYITMDNFDDVIVSEDSEGNVTEVNLDPTPDDILALAEKPKPAVNFTYPVRITNNAACTDGDSETKVYCAYHCDSSVPVESGNASGTEVNRCVQDDLDYMTADASIPAEAAVLDGDTGASRPALKILKTDADEYVAVLAYEETKGLSESTTADQGTTDTDIALEGKAVYFESFFWDQPVAVSAGRVVNLRVPEVDIVTDDNNVITSITPTGLDVYENARRVVIMGQVDGCEMQAGDYTFGLLYKQGFDTRGGSSDMYVRLNKGFTYDEFEPGAANISARESVYDDEGKVTSISWSPDNLLDQSYDNPLENTFSPRGWLRGSEIYNGFEYTPNWRQTESGTTPNNFWMHSNIGGVWQGPHQITYVEGAYGAGSGAHVSTLDPRFVPTAKGSSAGVAAGIASDASNPDVLFISYGTFNMADSEELDIFYSRSIDKGVNWEYFDPATDSMVSIPAPNADGIDGTADDAYRHAKLAHMAPDIEKEVQALGSPDGTMLFNVWMHETHLVDPLVIDGTLESEFGLVNYNFDPTAVVVP